MSRTLADEMSDVAAASVSPAEQSWRPRPMFPVDDTEELPKTFEEQVEPKASWYWVRAAAARVFASGAWDIILGLLIMLNLLLVVLETDCEASGRKTPWWVRTSNHLLSGIYLVELALRVYTYRVRFFFNAACCMDAAIVTSDVAFLLVDLVGGDDTMPSTSTLRIFKLLRLTRAVKVLAAFPELRLMLRGLKGATMSVFWGLALLIIALCVWGILFVQLVNEPNQQVYNAGLYDGCDRCPRAFSSVAEAMLTLTQQLVAGDSWGTVSLPIIEQAPWTLPLFAGVLVSVGLAIMNLILAVIVDSAQEARKTTDHEFARMKQLERGEAKTLLYLQCQKMDTDKSGSLCYEELLAGYDGDEAFQDALTILDIKRDDLAIVFEILDEDKSGDVDYDEFINELYSMKSHDSHTMLIFIKYYVEDLRVKVQSSLKMLESDIRRDLSAAGSHVVSQQRHSAKNNAEAALLPDVTCLAPRSEEKLVSAASFLASGAPTHSESASEVMRRARAVLVESLEAAKRIFEVAVSELRLDCDSQVDPPAREPLGTSPHYGGSAPEMVRKDAHGRGASSSDAARQLGQTHGASSQGMAPGDVSFEVTSNLATETLPAVIEELSQEELIQEEPLKMTL